MKWLLLILPIFLISCSSVNDRVDHCFVNQFSDDQAEVLTNGLIAWNHFLEVNYPEGDVTDKTIAYLHHLEKHTLYNPEWTFDPIACKEITAAFKSTRLLSELYTRGDELDGFDDFVKRIHDRNLTEADLLSGIYESDSLVIFNESRSYYFNKEGRFKTALIECSDYWPIMESYYALRAESNNISPAVICRGLEISFNEEDYTDPALQSIIFFELFINQMQEYLARLEGRSVMFY